MSDVTLILEAVARGEPQGAEQLLPLVYEELRKLAAQKMVSEPPGQTIQPTALVHEAYLRLVNVQRAQQADETFYVNLSSSLSTADLIMADAIGRGTIKNNDR